MQTTPIIIGNSKNNFSVYLSNFPSFSLDNFEGPLELLLYLIQKDEIDICSVEMSNLTSQFIQSLENLCEVEASSETLALAATLLMIKSQKLLPSQASEIQELEEDSRIELIQSLIEYCRVKDAAKALSLREEEQKSHFPRAAPLFERELGFGLEEIGIETLKSLALELLKKASLHPNQPILEEEWQVSDKLEQIRRIFKEQKKILFTQLFSENACRQELIVFFLALLEMMKHQEAKVVRENEVLYIYDTRT